MLTAAPPTIEISAMFDGKEYELKGAAMPTTRAYKRAVRGYKFVARVGGFVGIPAYH